MAPALPDRQKERTQETVQKVASSCGEVAVDTSDSRVPGLITHGLGVGTGGSLIASKSVGEEVLKGMGQNWLCVPGESSEGKGLYV